MPGHEPFETATTTTTNRRSAMRHVLAHSLTFLLLAIAAPATAQLPGFSGDYDAADAQYRAYALTGFQAAFNEWMSAVQARDVERASKVYSEGAFVSLGEPAPGAEDVKVVLSAWLASVDGIRTGLRDFDASGTIAYGTLHVVVNAKDPSEDGTGIMVFVMKRSGSSWKIRSQTLLLDRAG